jgi:anti-sigma regulatory factor (Ser/Thr protein kinase)
MCSGEVDDRDQARFPLPPDARAPGVARAHTRQFLGRWSLPAVLEPLALVVFELVGNAVRYGRPPFELILRRMGRGVRVDVHDERPGFGPTKSEPGRDDEGGRGLPLVDAVSTDRGVDQIPDDGKDVWAVVEPREGDTEA